MIRLSTLTEIPLWGRSEVLVLDNVEWLNLFLFVPLVGAFLKAKFESGLSVGCEARKGCTFNTVSRCRSESPPPKTLLQKMYNHADGCVFWQGVSHNEAPFFCVCVALRKQAITCSHNPCSWGVGPSERGADYCTITYERSGSMVTNDCAPIAGMSVVRVATPPQPTSAPSAPGQREGSRGRRCS